MRLEYKNLEGEISLVKAEIQTLKISQSNNTSCHCELFKKEMMKRQKRTTKPTMSNDELYEESNSNRTEELTIDITNF